MKLLLVGPKQLTDIRVIRAAVRTASWDRMVKKLVIPNVGMFSDVALRWAREQEIIAVEMPLETWRYGNSSRAAIERDDAAAKAASHMLVIMDYRQEQSAYWVKLANRRDLNLFIYYSV